MNKHALPRSANLLTLLVPAVCDATVANDKKNKDFYGII